MIRFHFAVAVLACLPAITNADQTFRPDQRELPVPPPTGSVVLLASDGTHQFSSKTGGEINWPAEAGVLTSARAEGRSNHIVSNWHFRDADIHVEFMLPAKGSGNSGIYIHGNYELQIIDSLGKDKLTQNEVGALYGFAPPLVNAGLDRGKWQVYDVRYRAPRRDAKQQIAEMGRVTAWLNGQCVQLDTEFGEPRSTYHPFRYKTTPYLQAIWAKQKESSVGPVFLQDHDNPVKFRNVWIKPLDDKAVNYQTTNP